MDVIFWYRSAFGMATSSILLTKHTFFFENAIFW
nr:MAG: hypothetical protein [Molluscum contagiosum virus]